MDSGHAHSVAAAKYYTARLAVAKQASGYGRRGLVIVLDAHRQRDFKQNEFPSPTTVKSKFSGKVIWVTESMEDQPEEFFVVDTKANRALIKRLLDHYPLHFKNDWILQYVNDPKILISNHFASPYFNGTPKEYVRVPREAQSAACSQWGGWALRFL